MVCYISMFFFENNLKMAKFFSLFGFVKVKRNPFEN